MLIIKQNKDDIPSFSYLCNKGEHEGKAFDLEIYICEDPLCDCRDITIEFFPKDKSDSTHYKLAIDLQKNELKKSTSRNDNLEFGNIFLEDITQDNWDELIFIHDQAKSMICEFADYSSLYTEFSFDDVENGNLIFYEEIIPYPAPIFIKIKDEFIKILDMYCLNPRCKCHETHLLFSPMADKHADNTDSLEEMHIAYDYKTKNWYVSELGNIDIAPEILMNRLISSFDISSIYSKHHKDLRMLYKNFREKYVDENITADSEKIPRNAPCPCGSGKKYKKCCMLKDI
jgi:hypothetical protein